MINFNKEDLEAVREIATRMWIDETHPKECRLQRLTSTTSLRLFLLPLWI